MKTKNTPWSIKILYWLTSFSFWILSALMIGVILLNLNFWPHVFENEMRISMPVPIEVLEEGILHLEDSDLIVKIDKAYGKLHFLAAPTYVVKMVLRTFLIIVLIGWFIAWKFRKFMINLKEGLLFEIENINNLKHISYALIVLFILSRVYVGVLTTMMKPQLEFSSIKIGGEALNTDIIIEFALLLWVLAHVFVKGVEMKEEHELTI
jgi:hypothetical protein